MLRGALLNRSLFDLVFSEEEFKLLLDLYKNPEGLDCTNRPFISLRNHGLIEQFGFYTGENFCKIAPKGVLYVKNFLREKRLSKHHEIRSWITTVIAVLAFILSIISLVLHYV